MVHTLLPFKCIGDLETKKNDFIPTSDFIKCPAKY